MVGKYTRFDPLKRFGGGGVYFLGDPAEIIERQHMRGKLISNTVWLNVEKNLHDANTLTKSDGIPVTRGGLRFLWWLAL
jgi:hypothetical protein